jgi:hypothetical protein
MSESDVRKTARLKREIERELTQLLKKLEAGTIDRKSLESGLRRVRVSVTKVPWFKGE